MHACVCMCRKRLLYVYVSAEQEKSQEQWNLRKWKKRFEKNAVECAVT